MKNKFKKIIAGVLVCSSMIIPSTITLAKTTSGVTTGKYVYNGSIIKGWAEYPHGLVTCKITLGGQKQQKLNYIKAVTNPVYGQKSKAVVYGWR